MGNPYQVGGIPPPLKNLKVKWDDDIPNIWKNKNHVPNHQPEMDDVRPGIGLFQETSIQEHENSHESMRVKARNIETKNKDEL